MGNLGIATLLALFVIITGCTRSVSDKSKVTVKFPTQDESASSSKTVVQSLSQNVGALAGTKWGLPVPANVRSLNCFALSVKAPDLKNAITCSTLAGSSGLTDNIYGVFKEGDELTFEIPSGEERTIGLIGFYTDNLDYCVSLGDSFYLPT
ncbi:MAG: hypothetical protein K0R29_3008 [Pseudobdellovibrio sp.]|nr:hypothetical protein [Pseudobdellovibrio sp.]